MNRDRQTCMTVCYGALIAALVFGGTRPLAAADVCITMTGSNGQVGGLQMDLTWDPSCMTAVHAQGDAAKCASNPSTGKNVQTKLAGNSAMRTIFLSMSDTNPAPDDELFCCQFTLAGRQTSPCCSLNIGNLILAGPTGGRVYDPGISIQASIDTAPCTASAAGGSPANPVRPPAVPMIIPPPAVSAPGAVPPAPGGGVPPPQAPAQVAPRGMPPVSGGEAAAPPEEAAPTAAETPAAVTPAVPYAPTARRTPALPTATPQARTPQARPTATAAATSATPAAPTPTPARKHKAHKKRQQTS